MDALAKGVEQLGGGQARPRQFVWRNFPYCGDLGPVHRIVQLAIARQLISLLAVFATALPIALPGHAGIAAKGLSGVAKREHKINERQNVVHALALLFRAASGQEHRSIGFAEYLSGFLQQSCWHPRNPFHSIGPIPRDSAFDLLEVSGSRSN